jgi:hypothetical protein
MNKRLNESNKGEGLNETDEGEGLNEREVRD